MSRIETIRKRVAYFLLIVFALSITPKIAFHEALAEHNDGGVCQDKDKTAPHLHQPAFHCSFDDLVVSSPYLSVELKKTPEPPLYYLQTSAQFTTYTLSSIPLRRENRGPPMA